MKSKFLVFLLLFTTAVSISAQHQKLTQRLTDHINELSDANNFIRTLVYFSDQVDVVSMDKQFYRTGTSLEDRTKTVIRVLREKAKTSQPDILNYLEQKQLEGTVFRYESFWIAWI